MGNSKFKTVVTEQWSINGKGSHLLRDRLKRSRHDKSRAKPYIVMS